MHIEYILHTWIRTKERKIKSRTLGIENEAYLRGKSNIENYDCWLKTYSVIWRFPKYIKRIKIITINL